MGQETWFTSRTRTPTISHDNINLAKLLMCFGNPSLDFRGIPDVDRRADSSGMIRSSLELGELIAADVAAAERHIYTLGKIGLHDGVSNAL